MWWHKRNDDLQRELDSHLDLLAEEHNGDRRAARRTLGNMARIQEDTRATWGWLWLDRIAQDLRYSLRSLLRRPVFTAVAVLSLAIAIGANTAIFSFANTILIRKLPVPGADRLVVIKQNNVAFNIENCCFLYRVFQGLRQEASDFQDLTALSQGLVILTDDGQAEKLQVEFVVGNYFRALGVRAAAGRLIEEADDGPEGTGSVAVISHRLWMQRYGGRTDVIGRRVTINAEPFRIVGVTENGFTGASLHSPRDIQIPASMSYQLQGMSRDRDGVLQIIGRLKPGVTRQAAALRLDPIGKRMEREIGLRITDRDDFRLYDGSQGVNSRKPELGRAVTMLMLLVGTVLLVASANLAALLLVRSVDRVREAGMRAALGASRFALFRHCFTESVLIATAGGACGWILASLFASVLSTIFAAQYPDLAAQTSLDSLALGFTIGVSALAAILFGVLPAQRLAHSDPLPSIHGALSSNPRRRPLLSRAIVAVEVALSVTLLFCAGLFARSLANLRAVDLGFDTDHLIVMEPDLATYNGPQKRRFFADLEARARDLPGVRSASASWLGHLTGGSARLSLSVPGYTPRDGIMPTAPFNRIGPAYLQTLGIPLIAGRELTATDTVEAVPISAIVDQLFVRRFLTGDPIGQTFQFGARRPARIVGVAGGSKFQDLRQEAEPMFYLPINSFPSLLQVRTFGDPGPVAAQLRGVALTLDPRLRFTRLSTFEAHVDDVLARERLLAFLSTVLGGVAVVLSAIGLYGVLAFSVARRTREVGIRVAIGANRPSILTLFLKEGAWPIAMGIAAGLPLALLGARWIETLLYGLEPQDPASIALSIGLLVLAATAASLIPAWRATRIDPMRALRQD